MTMIASTLERKKPWSVEKAQLAHFHSEYVPERECTSWWCGSTAFMRYPARQ